MFGVTMTSFKRLLGVWRTMHNRCYNKKQKCYPHYGGRGIFVDVRWHGADGFQTFLRDMGECPEGATLDRKDNSGPYSRENCRWATRTEQARNKRNNRFITANGETKTLREWANSLKCSPSAILYRINKGMDEEKAVTMSIPSRPNSKLTLEQAVYVKKTYPTLSMQALANQLGVSKKSILNIVHGVTFVDAA
jgi:transposase